MASLFDKVVVGINKGVNSVSENSKTIIEKAKINSDIENYNNQKNDLFLQLGELIYNLHENGEISVPQCEGICNAIVSCENDIRVLYTKLQELEKERMRSAFSNISVENGIKCDCGYINSATAKFCAGCGRELIMLSSDEKKTAGRVCECGYVNKETSKYCMNCGKALTD